MWPVLCRFSTKIQQLKESGLIDHWIAEEQDKVARVAKIGTATRDVVGLSVSNLQGPFYMWILFICIAAAFFLLEVCIGQLDMKLMGRKEERISWKIFFIRSTINYQNVIIYEEDISS